MDIVDKYSLSRENMVPTKFSENIKNRYSRYGMYKSIEKTIIGLKLKPGGCLLVGDTYDGAGVNFRHSKSTAPILINMLPLGTTVTAPPYPEVDMHKMPYKDNYFDYVIADNVIEHVRKPWICAEEARRVLVPGGIGIFISGLMCPVHGAPDDYFRFTPFGLRVLCENFSEIIESRGLGNRRFIEDIWIKDLQKENISNNPSYIHRSFKNDDRFLIMTWIIAKK